METGNVGCWCRGKGARKDPSSLRRTGNYVVSANRLTFFLSLVVPVATVSATAATVEFADAKSIDGRSGGQSVYAVDLDGDDDLDVLSAIVFHEFYQYENTDGLGLFSDGADHFSTVLVGPTAVSAADLNGDGYMDVLAASGNDSTNLLMWFNNTDGSGDFSSPTGGITIPTDTKDVRWVTAADIDGDGDMDVLTASYNDSRVVWYSNTDGQGMFGVGQDISTTALGANMLFVADLDGDGDMDVVVASVDDNSITWFRNEDGKGDFTLGVNIASDAKWAGSVYAADIDGDSDLDVVSASTGDGRIAWYENTDGQGTFSTGVDIGIVNRASSVVAADLDNDGDMDLVCCSGVVDDKRIVWFENTDGKGSFAPSDDVPLTDDYFAGCKLITADLDGDGDLDLLAAFWHDDGVVWYENLISIDGDTSTFSPTISPTSSPSVEGLTLPTAVPASSVPLPPSSEDTTETPVTNDPSSAVDSAMPSTVTSPVSSSESETPVTHDATSPVDSAMPSTVTSPVSSSESETPVTNDPSSAVDSAMPSTVTIPVSSSEPGGGEWADAASEIVVTVVGTVVGGVLLAITLYYINKHLLSQPAITRTAT